MAAETYPHPMAGDIHALCAALGSEPLFHLSLQSKELFHSNFVGWLCESHPQVGADVFGRWVSRRPEATTLRVQRERSHLDLAIELPGLTPFVLENKVFAPPDESQLDNYAAGKLAGLARPELLLLSLGRPRWDDGTYECASGELWRYLSYRDLADALEPAAAALATRSFDRQLVEHYCALIRLLDDLAQTVGMVASDEPIDVPATIKLVLQQNRLHDAVGKLRARHAIAAASARTGPALEGREVRWEASFTRSHALTAAFIRHSDTDWLGWQYQEGQWRVVVITSMHQGKTPELRARRHAYVADRYGAWFAFDAIPTVTGRSIDKVPPTEARGAFNNFDPDFVYRYRQMKDVTLSELVALSDHYLRAAAEWAST